MMLELLMAIGYAVVVVSGAFLLVRARERGQRRRRRELGIMRRRLHHGLALPGITVFSVDGNGVVTWFAGPEIEAAGLSSDAVGRPAADLVREWPAWSTAVARSVRGERASLTVEAGDQALDVTSAPLHDDDGKMTEAVFAVRDVTDVRREAERAERLAHMRSTALATINHKIRGHLNGILGMADLLEASPLTEQQREWLSLSTASGEQLLTFVDQLIQFMELDASSTAIEERPFSLRSVIDGVTASRHAEAEADGTTFVTRYPLTVSEHFAGDAARVRRMIDLVLAVALGTNPGGEVLLNVEERGRAGDDVTLVISIEDRGRGLGPTALTRVFDGLESPSAMWASRSEGTGLELPIARMLARSMGGDLSVDSARGVGTTVRAELTLARATAADVESHDADRRLGTDGGAPLRALVVDDSRVQQRVASSLLRQLGHEPITASSGPEALELLDREHFDIVFTELHMPDMDGFRLADAIREREALASLPLVAITSDNRPETRARAHEAGLDGFVEKPIAPEALLAYLRPADGVLPAGSDGGTLDLAALDAMRGADAATGQLAAEFVAAFLDATPVQLIEVRDAAIALDGARLAPVLDSVATSARLVGAAGLEQRCRDLREAVAEGDLLETRRVSDALATEFASVRRSLLARNESGAA